MTVGGNIMTVDQMRLYISQHSRYKSSEWNKKVTRMPDNQVIAIYYKFKAQEKPVGEENHHIVTEGRWKCDICEYRPICNIFEQRNPMEPIIDCDEFKDLVEEEESNDD